MVAFSKALVFGLFAGLANKARAVTLQESMSHSMRVLSKAEIMASMTSERAVATVLKHKEVLAKPELVNILSELKGNSSSLQQVRSHGQDKADPPKGYAAVAPARDMLNEMMNDAQAKLDNKVESCSTFNRETLSELERIRQDVASFNSQAAEARGRVLKAQSVISFCNTKMPQVDEELQQHNDECTREKAAIGGQIDIVNADLDVMGSILTIIGDCPDAVEANLIQCRHCRAHGEGFVMLQDGGMQKLLDKLKSNEARRVVQQGLGQLYQESADEQEPMMLSQMQVQRLRRTKKALRAGQDPNDPEFIAAMGNESLNIAEVPEETMPQDCVPTNKCTLGAGSCPKVRDRFLYIEAGVSDMLEQLKDDLAELQRNCESNRVVMEDQIANLGEKLRNGQTDLGTGTRDQVDSESSSNLKGQQHGQLTHEYGETMKGCCAEQNDLKSEVCALAKIRGELFKMKGVEALITDCAVTDFKAGQCSMTCGGGFLVKSRSILVHPVNGMACPALEMRESCNTHPCPIDCQVGDWEDWSGCTADCGGGVRERMRPTLQGMKYGGQPCEDTEETEGCNAQSCNKNCDLAEWSPWGSCTQACWTGTERRDRGVAEAAQGTGACADPTSESRLQFRKCNNVPCTKFYHREKGKNWLKCKSKTDIIILMDGSGSLGTYGWKKSKVFVENLIEHLQGGENYVKVAVQLFSGPTSSSARKRCTGQAGKAPDLEKDCSIKWVSHFNYDMSKTAQEVENLVFPRKTTLTSVALAEAEAELMYGRDDAASVVIVVTDGKPLSQTRTRQAAARLMQKARLIWVPVGRGAPNKLIEELASQPKRENIIKISSFRQLRWPYFANKIIAQTCPVLATP